MKQTFLIMMLSMNVTIAWPVAEVRADEGEVDLCETSDLKTLKPNERQACYEYLKNAKKGKSDKEKEDYDIKLKELEHIEYAANNKAKPTSNNSPQASNQSGSSSDKNSCSPQEPESSKKFADTDGKTYTGSSNLAKCDRLSRGFMDQLYSSTGSRSAPANFSWKKIAEYECKDKCKDPAVFKKCTAEKMNFGKQCESIAYILAVHGRDWDNEEHLKPVGASNTGAKSPSGIQCQSKGIETLDYEACKKFQEQLELMEVVQKVGYDTQQLIYQDKLMDSQTKHAQEQNAATGALKSTKDSIKMQQDIMQQRTAVDATKLAVLYNTYSDMPRTSDVLEKCEEITKFEITEFPSKIDVNTCKAAARPGQGGFALLLNQQNLEAMKSKLIAIATSAGSNAILANLLGKRAKDLDNAIAKIEDFKPIDPFTVSEDEATTTLCKQNPGLPQCLTGGLETTFDTISDNVITFGDGGTGTSYGGITSIKDGATTDTAAVGTKRETVDPMGNVISAASKDNSIEGSSGANVKTSGTGSTGSGGGGGGGASGGGGGGGLPQPGDPGGVKAAEQGKTPTYAGGGGFSIMGGFGINKKKGDGKEENPFGKLFGKDGKESGVVNFRDLASQKLGGKGDNIFEMISKRYSTVAADKRLMEYELAK